MGTGRRLRRIFPASILVLVAPFATALHAQERAADLAQSLQRKYDTIHDFSADFVHTYQGGVLRKQITERGRVLIKKPGKMRWEYTTPE
jgi:outer membrane lipoprotein-sorting protein